MSLAKTSDTIPEPGTRAVSTRRTLFSGAAAVVIGSGITAGAAASVADLVPGEDADAVLLAICARAEAEDGLSTEANNRAEAIMREQGHTSEWRAVCDQCNGHFGAFVDLAEQAAGIPALTVAGMRAKARIVYINANTKVQDDDLQALILRDLGWGA